MRCPIVYFHLYLGLALTLWVGELLTWPSALLGGNYEGDRVPEVGERGALDAMLTRGDETWEAFVRRNEAVAASWFSSG